MNARIPGQFPIGAATGFGVCDRISARPDRRLQGTLAPREDPVAGNSTDYRSIPNATERLAIAHSGKRRPGCGTTGGERN